MPFGVFLCKVFPMNLKKTQTLRFFYICKLALQNVVPFLGDVHLLDTNLQSHTVQYFCMQSEAFVFLHLVQDFQNKETFSRDWTYPLEIISGFVYK